LYCDRQDVCEKALRFRSSHYEHQHDGDVVPWTRLQETSELHEVAGVADINEDWNYVDGDAGYSARSMLLASLFLLNLENEDLVQRSDQRRKKKAQQQELFLLLSCFEHQSGNSDYRYLLHREAKFGAHHLTIFFLRFHDPS
jgi:hypothetical protein